MADYRYEVHIQTDGCYVAVTLQRFVRSADGIETVTTVMTKAQALASIKWAVKKLPQYKLFQEGSAWAADLYDTVTKRYVSYSIRL